MLLKSNSTAKILGCFLLTAALLSGCGDSNAGGSEPPVSQEETAAETAAAPAAPAETTESPAAPEENKEVSAEESENAKIIYEGRYFDEKWYYYVDAPAEDSPLVYCAVIISNVTDTSFDFTINEEEMATGGITPVVSAGTAQIEDGGATAVYNGDDMTLTFSFPDDPDTFPQHLKISGLEKLEDTVYLNNSIPGHESG